MAEPEDSARYLSPNELSDFPTLASDQSVTEMCQISRINPFNIFFITFSTKFLIRVLHPQGYINNQFFGLFLIQALTRSLKAARKSAAPKSVRKRERIDTYTHDAIGEYRPSLEHIDVVAGTVSWGRLTRGDQQLRNAFRAFSPTQKTLYFRLISILSSFVKIQDMHTKRCFHGVSST